jgi:3-phosphoshikimate 1-carboxyvinyltransferase
MTDLVVHPLAAPLVGSVPVPPDRSIGHRAIVLASLCVGVSDLRGLSAGEDTVATVNAMRALGAKLEGGAAGELRITGTGLMGLRPSLEPIDCGRSPTTLGLLAGVLAGQDFASTLGGSASLAETPMLGVVGPLRARGAQVEGAPHPTREGELVAPLVIGPLPEGKELLGLEVASVSSSALVKGAVLLSGLYAHGTTWFREPALSRDHTERMLHALGVPLRTVGTMIELEPAGWDGKLPAFDMTVPGDVSSAAFLLVAAQLHAGSRVTVRGVGVNPTRTGLFEIARHMGAGLEIVPQGEHGGEPVAEVTAWPGALRGRNVAGEVVARATSELALACALGARAAGTTTIRDTSDTPSLAAMLGVLRAFGVTCDALPDGLVVEGREAPLEPARIDSRGDHRIAMTAAVLALAGRGPSTIVDCDCIATSFPRFVGTLRALGARIDVA